MKPRWSALLCGVLLASVSSAGEQVAFPFDSTVVAIDTSDEVARFAAAELNEIVKLATGREFKVEKTGGGGQRRTHCILLRRDDAYAPEESAVFVKDGDLHLVGGDELGMLWAVYDFVEDNLDYRWFEFRPCGETVSKCETVVFRGTASRRRPSFRGFRETETNWRFWKFMLRNRSNVILERKLKEGKWRYRFGKRIHGHGYNWYLPAGKADLRKFSFVHAFGGIEDEMFRKHPGYFSLDRDGKRSPKMQLCFSNAEMRDAFWKALKTYIDDPEQGGPGIYMLGVNDEHSGVPCYCERCRELDRRYDCGAGAHWEFVADMCNRVKTAGYEGVYLTALAYRRQCEKAPKGIVFPDNFRCYLAIGNHTHTPIEWGEEQRREGAEWAKSGEIYNFYRNALDWGKLGKIDYWMYTDPFLSTGYRIQKELKEMLAANAEGVFQNGGFLGSGGGTAAFSGINDYLFLRLAYNVDLDVRAETDRYFAHLFGPAAFAARRFYDMCEEVRLANITVSKRLDGFGYFSGARIAELGRLFDRGRELVKGTPYAENFGYLDMYVDMLKVVYAPAVKKEAPGYRYDAKACAARANAESKAWFDRYMFGVYRKRMSRIEVEEMIAQMAYYPLLKDESLPAELAKYDPKSVTLVLPEERRSLEWYWVNNDRDYALSHPKYTAEEDPLTATGWTCGGDVPEGVVFTKKDPPAFNFYEHSSGTYLIHNKYVPMDFFERGRYRLFCLGKTKIRPTSIMNFGRFGVNTHATRQFELRRLADPIFLDKEFEIWADVRAEGPMFFPEDAGKRNRLFVSRYFVVE